MKQGGDLLGCPSLRELPLTATLPRHTIAAGSHLWQGGASFNHPNLRTLSSSSAHRLLLQRGVLVSLQRVRPG